MKLQKITGFVLAALMITGTAAFACAPSITADAAAAAELNTTNAELFLPESYEQYLPLEKPSDAAFSENFIAVADGKYIYICDRSDPAKCRYARYTHLPDSPDVAVKKLQFSNDGSLYFADSSAANLFELDTKAIEELFAGGETVAKTYSGISSATFLIVNDTVYTASTSSLSSSSVYAYPLDSIVVNANPVATVTTKESLLMTSLGNTFYCLANDDKNGYLVYEYDISGGKFQVNASVKFVAASSLCAAGESIYYSTSAGIFRADGRFASSQKISDRETGALLASYKEKLYSIRGNSVREIDVSEEEGRLTGFEIGAASSSTNRLSGAEEIVRAGNLVVTADAGNNRVTVYDGSTKSYDTVPVTRNGVSYTPDIVAADKDGAKIAVSSGKYIFMYEKTQEGFTLSYVNETSTAVTGLTFVYGECYFVTENSGYGYTDENKTEVSANYFSGKGANPSALASDLYGQIYVAFGNAVYSYTEDEFRNTAQVQKNAVLTLPAEAKSLRCDYEGNLYYLSGNGLYQNGEQIAAVDGSDFVYSQTCAPLSFALGFEDDEVYFNFGNFVVKSKAGTLESIPTLNEIDVGTAGDDAFALHENNLLVDIPAHSVGIRTDLAALKGNDSVYFPYSQYYRTAEDKRGVLLAETEDYYLVALFESDRSYSANLFRKNGGAVIADESGYRGESPFTAAYLTNAVNLYCAPCLHEALASRRIERGDKLSVLGVVTATEGDYAFVELQGGERTAVRGYVPLSYLTEANPLGAVTETYTVGTVKCGKDGVEFTAENGDKITVTGRAEAKIADNGDGTFTVKIERNGKIYTAQVTEKQIARGESDALRTSLIIILSVLAVVIVAAYVYLVPHKYYRRK